MMTQFLYNARRIPSIGANVRGGANVYTSKQDNISHLVDCIGSQTHAHITQSKPEAQNNSVQNMLCNYSM